MAHHKRTLLLGGSDSLIAKSRGLDLDLVNLRAAKDISPQTAELCSRVDVLDLQNTPVVDELVLQLHAETPFARVVCHSEPLQMLAAHVTELLTLEGNSLRTVTTLRDKLNLRDVLRERGLSRVEARIATSADDLIEFVNHRGAAIAKPRRGGGSFGVRKISNVAEAHEAWTWAASVGLREVMVEEVLTGTEVSLEFYTAAGEHAHLATTSKELNFGFIEVAHAVPATVSTSALDQARELVRSTLDAVGLVWGPSHTEVMLTADGPEIIESHSRRAGGHINELVRLVHGYDMERLVFEDCSTERTTPVLPTQPQGAAAVHFVTPPPGVIRTVSGLDAARDLPGVVKAEVLVGPGNRISAHQWAGDYAGYAITRSRTASEATALAREASARIVFDLARDGDWPSSTDDMSASRLVGSAFDSFDSSILGCRDAAPLNARIGVLTGGVSNERDRSLLSGRAVFEALAAEGHSVQLIDTADPALPTLLSEIDIAFLAVAGQYAEDGKLQGLLEMLGVPYTGSGVLASALGMQKGAFKRFAVQHGFDVLEDLPVDPTTPADVLVKSVHEALGYPVMLKPSSEGGSVGMTLARTPTELLEAIEAIDVSSGVDYFLERYCDGRTVTVGVVEGDDGIRALPVLEVSTERGFYDYESKRDPSLHQYACPADLEASTSEALRVTALQVHQALGCIGYSRVDFILHADGKPRLLEINTLPGLSRGGNLATMAAADGISYYELIVRILASASNRARYVP